jgi:hypothetical protein
MESDDAIKNSLHRTRIGLALMTLVTLLFMVYGYTQSIEAQRQAEVAIANEKKALLAENEVIHYRDRAEDVRHTMQETIERLQTELQNCAAKK